MSRYSVDYGNTWQDVPSSSTNNATCAVEGNQMIIVDYDSSNSTRQVQYTSDASSWTTATIETPSSDSHLYDVAISSSQIVFVGEHGLVYSSTDGSTFTKQDVSLTETLYAVSSYSSGFYFANSSLTDTTMSLYSLEISAGGGSSTPTILFNTSPLIKRLSSTIDSQNSLTFTLSLDHASANCYMIQLLKEDDISTSPFFTGVLHITENDNFIVPITQHKISSVSYATNVVTFSLDATYSGSFNFSYKLIN